MSMPAPATSHAISAPATPVSWAKRRGSENTPAPTIDPTTIPVIVMKVSLCAAEVSGPAVAGHSSARQGELSSPCAGDSGLPASGGGPAVAAGQVAEVGHQL